MSDIDYAPMAPSTWLRLDEDVSWLYGLKDRRGMRHDAADILRIRRPVAVERLWQKDLLKRPYTSLDATPMACAQGDNRYDRFLNFRAYVKGFPDWGRQSSFHTFEALGHEYKRAFADPALVAFCCN